MNKSIFSLALIAAAALMPVGASSASSYDFASSVVSSSSLPVSVYDNPANALGQPSTQGGGYDFSMVYPDYGKNSSGSESLVELGGKGNVEYAMSQAISYNPNSYYGDAFTVFGNTMFSAGGVTATTNMATDDISKTAGIFQNGTPIVTVIGTNSSGATLSYTYTSSSAALPTWYPTNPYTWVGNSASDPSGFGTLNNYSLPVNPDLTLSSFDSESVAYADNTLYDGSAGGASFSWAPLLADGITTIDDIDVQGSGSGSNIIEGISAVGASPAPEAGSLLFGIVGASVLGFLLIKKRRCVSAA
jgi:hypothetical protein